MTSLSPWTLRKTIKKTKTKNKTDVTYQTRVGVFQPLYYYMRNFCNLIGLEQWYFSLI